MKQKKLMVIGVLLLIVALVGGGFYMYVGDTSFTWGGSSKNGVSLAGVYDTDGNPIKTDTQATVGGISGVRYVTLRVNAMNKDTIPLKFNIVSSSPTNFETSLAQSTEKTVGAGETASWISDLIDIKSYEGTTAQFTVTVRAESDARQPSEKTYTFDLIVDTDPLSVFDVNIEQSTSDPEFDLPDCTLNSHCGTSNLCVDNICVPAPQCTINSDCDSGYICESSNCVLAPVSRGIIFRTTDLSYKTGAIALSRTCGGQLIGYGRTSGVCINHYCDDSTGAILINAPASNSLGYTYIWLDADTKACVCEAVAVGSHVYSKSYTTVDSDASSVSVASTSVDATKEVAC